MENKEIVWPQTFELFCSVVFNTATLYYFKYLFPDMSVYVYKITKM